MRPRDGRPQRVSRLPHQDGRSDQDVEPALVPVRPLETLAALLHGQVGEQDARWNILPVYRGYIRRPPPHRQEPEPETNVLRQDLRPHLLPRGAIRRGHEDMDRCDFYRCRGI